MNRKNQVMVDFPLENLNLSKYVIGYDKDSYVYDLYGVCNHSGSVMGGHYTAFVKNANGKWYHYNDTNVAEVAMEQQIKTPKAYCFFYRKRTNKK
jgi:ubiquitin C-terminal hydrolase